MPKEKKKHKGTENLIPCKPGQTNNPNGAPKGKRITTILNNIMKKKISLKMIDKDVKELATVRNAKKNGQDIEAQEALALKIFALAMQGDAQIIKEVLNRLEGKVIDEVKVYGDDAVEYDLNKLTTKEVKELERILKKATPST